MEVRLTLGRRNDLDADPKRFRAAEVFFGLALGHKLGANFRYRERSRYFDSGHAEISCPEVALIAVFNGTLRQGRILWTAGRAVKIPALEVSRRCEPWGAVQTWRQRESLPWPPAFCG